MTAFLPHMRVMPIFTGIGIITAETISVETSFTKVNGIRNVTTTMGNIITVAVMKFMETGLQTTIKDLSTGRMMTAAVVIIPLMDNLNHAYCPTD